MVSKRRVYWLSNWEWIISVQITATTGACGLRIYLLYTLWSKESMIALLMILEREKDMVLIYFNYGFRWIWENFNCKLKGKKEEIDIFFLERKGNFD